jgi:sensor histidine kinase YesM
LLVSIGFVIFLLLAFFYAWRYKRPISGIDASMLFLALLLQGFSLFMIEVGSFTLSMQAGHGWILMLWLITFGSPWVLLFAMMGHLKR